MRRNWSFVDDVKAKKNFSLCFDSQLQENKERDERDYTNKNLDIITETISVQKTL